MGQSSANAALFSAAELDRYVIQSPLLARALTGRSQHDSYPHKLDFEKDLGHTRRGSDSYSFIVSIARKALGLGRYPGYDDENMPKMKCMGDHGKWFCIPCINQDEVENATTELLAIYEHTQVFMCKAFPGKDSILLARGIRGDYAMYVIAKLLLHDGLSPISLVVDQMDSYSATDEAYGGYLDGYSVEFLRHVPIRDILFSAFNVCLKGNGNRILEGEELFVIHRSPIGLMQIPRHEIHVDKQRFNILQSAINPGVVRDMQDCINRIEASTKDRESNLKLLSITMNNIK